LGKEQLVHPVSGLLLHRQRHMTVQVHGDPNLSVTQFLAHDFHRHSLRKKEGSCGMTQVVEALFRQSGLCEASLERFGCRSSIHRSSSCIREDEVPEFGCDVTLPEVAGDVALAQLEFPLRMERL
jgi:hypothetical protein